GKFRSARIIVAADDDYLTPGNPGLTKAREAATAVAAEVAVPDFGADRPNGATDFNDLEQHAGADAVRRCLEAAAPVLADTKNDNADSKRGSAGDGKGPSQRDKLLSVADLGEFWRCPDGIAHVSVPVDGHVEHHRVRSQRFRDWLIVR